jgi:hypothetical protein
MTRVGGLGQRGGGGGGEDRTRWTGRSQGRAGQGVRVSGLSLYFLFFTFWHRESPPAPLRIQRPRQKGLVIRRRRTPKYLSQSCACIS